MDRSFITRCKLSSKISDKIEEQSYKVPWFFFHDCALDEKTIKKEGLEKNPYFSHALSHESGKWKSDHYFLFPMDFISQFSHMHDRTMIRSHITFHYPNENKFGKYHNLHIDNEKPHDVVLYYINDADGDTFFFDNDRKIIHRETPEKGKLIIFDGSIFHSSSSPSKNIRMTMNINYSKSNRPLIKVTQKTHCKI